MKPHGQNNRMTDKPIILLFIRVPIKGQVKSRLAAELGEETALDLYTSFVLDIIDTLEGTGYPLIVYYYPQAGADTLAPLLGQHCRLMPQEGKDLGERMENAFRQIFSEGYTRAILIGSDIPDLTPAVLQDALESLRTSDVVIGPAADGGYYLIGFRKGSLLPGIFRTREWGTERVFQQTMDLLRNALLRIHLAPEWKDVDTIEDLRSLVLRSRDSVFDRSRTMIYLKQKSIITV